MQNVDVLSSSVARMLGKFLKNIALQQRLIFSRKSQIALEYCYRFKSRNPSAHVIWLNASSAGKLGEDCNNVAEQLGLKALTTSTSKSTRSILECLCEYKWGQCLIILDDVQNNDGDTTFDLRNGQSSSEVSPLCQNSRIILFAEHGSIVVTSRNMQTAQALGIFGEPIIVLQFVVDNVQDMVRLQCLPHLRN